MTILWPDALLRPRNVSFDIVPRTVAGGASISGSTQAISSAAGLWKASFDQIVVNTRDRVLVWRAMAAILEGRSGSVLVPRCRGYQPVPAGAVAAGYYGGSISHSDGTYFSDGTGYLNQVIDVQLSAGILAGATSADIAITYADSLLPGHDFSLGNRMYRIKSVTYLTATTATITFLPPAREAAAISTQLNFDNPVCQMRLASDSEMDLLLESMKRAEPTVNFIEDV